MKANTKLILVVDSLICILVPSFALLCSVAEPSTLWWCWCHIVLHSVQYEFEVSLWILPHLVPKSLAKPSEKTQLFTFSLCSTNLFIQNFQLEITLLNMDTHTFLRKSKKRGPPLSLKKSNIATKQKWVTVKVKVHRSLFILRCIIWCFCELSNCPVPNLCCSLWSWNSRIKFLIIFLDLAVDRKKLSGEVSQTDLSELI